ncbi:MAG: DUF3078 domain-containing protein [Tidjanibacter sp.]|nr:DUF3078 domain-containing protein [Tidjanibacter sp.]MBR7129213.1 DUF3078 domain-containing protein [Tidjanibacter sp.]
MKKFLLSAAALLACVSLWAEEPQAEPSPWKMAGSAGITGSQMTLTNWAAGGDPSVAADFQFNYSIDYQKDNSLWQNRLELAYGLNRTESNGTRKTNDKIYFSSSYGQKVHDGLYVSALVKFNTQFANGFDYAVKNDNGSYKQTSGFMAPAYFSGGLGVEWKPKGWLSVNASPATWKATLVNDEVLRPFYGLEADQMMRHEFGGNVKIEAQGKIVGDLSGYTRLNLFSNFLDNPQNVDVDWTMRLDLKINKWLSANVNLHAIYDDDIKIPQPDGTLGRRLQLQEVAGVGLLVKF